MQVLLAERFARRTSPFTLRDGLLLLLPRRCNGPPHNGSRDCAGDKLPEFKNKDLSIPLGSSSCWVETLLNLVVPLISKHGPDDANQLASRRAVVCLAFDSHVIVVRSRLGTTSDVSGHCFHHRCFAASVELAWGSCSAQLT